MQMTYSIGNKKEPLIGSLIVRWGGLEPPRLYGTWPSTMPVCQFQHQRNSHGIITTCEYLSSKCCLIEEA